MTEEERSSSESVSGSATEGSTENTTDAHPGPLPTLTQLMAFKCGTCGGTERTWRDCWNCDGEGEVEDPDWENETGVGGCTHCGGRGGYFLCAKCAPPERDPYDDFEDGPC